jgi:hypothetical protein
MMAGLPCGAGSPVWGAQALDLSSPYRSFHSSASRVDVATFEVEAWARDHVLARIPGSSEA